MILQGRLSRAAKRRGKKTRRRRRLLLLSSSPIRCLRVPPSCRLIGPWRGRVPVAVVVVVGVVVGRKK